MGCYQSQDCTDVGNLSWLTEALRGTLCGIWRQIPFLAGNAAERLPAHLQKLDSNGSVDLGWRADATAFQQEIAEARAKSMTARVRSHQNTACRASSLLAMATSRKNLNTYLHNASCG